MEICNLCGKKFKTKQGLNSHMGWHNNSNRSNNLEKYNKSIQDGKRDPKNQYSYGAVCSEETRKKIGESSKDRKLSPEQKKKRSEAMKRAVKNNPESYSASNVCGRTKLLGYKGYNLNGKWELEVAKWLDSQEIEWTNKIEKGFEYEWEDNIHLYFPDFYLPEYDLYIEVKGYERDRDKLKWKAIKKLIVIKKNEIEKIKNGIFGPLAQLVEQDTHNVKVGGS